MNNKLNLRITMIKKSMLLLAFIAMLTNGLGQESSQREFGRIFIAGGLNVTSVNNNNNIDNTFGMNLALGREVSDELVVGLLVTYVEYYEVSIIFGDQIDPTPNKIEQFGFGIFARQKFTITDKLDFVSQVSVRKIQEGGDSGLNINILPVLNYQVTNTLGIDVNFGGLVYQNNSDTEVSTYLFDLDLQNVNVGVNFTF